MNITYIGHACFAIESNGYKVVVDPYEAGSVPGFNPIDEEADLVLCSHQHFDHNAASEIKLRAGSENPFTITVIDTYHDECHGEKRGPNKIHIFDDGESKVAHLGDLGCDINVDLTEDERAMLTGLDAIMVPIGGTYTIDAKAATELIKQLGPKIAIPMHYRSNNFQFGLKDITTDDYFSAIFAEDGMVMVKRDDTIDSKSTPLAQAVFLRAKNA